MNGTRWLWRTVVGGTRMSLMCVALACLASRGVCAYDRLAPASVETQARALSVALRARLRDIAGRRPAATGRRHPTAPKAVARSIAAGVSRPFRPRTSPPYREILGPSASWTRAPAHVSPTQVDVEAARAWMSFALASLRRPVAPEQVTGLGSGWLLGSQFGQTHPGISATDGAILSPRPRSRTQARLDIWRRRRRPMPRRAHA
jgi:hypothetical protein